jgi:hypothetical protein
VSEQPVTIEAFGKLYDERLKQVYAYWNPQMQDEIGAHCAGWRTDRFDFGTYLSRSVHRFHRAYHALAESGCRTVCDVGGMWGLLPLVLRDLGYDVCMTEARSYYTESFDPLFSFIEAQGVEILDYDPFAEDARLDRTFDGVLALAILEHYPHSLKGFMSNVMRLMPGDGMLYIEVPNIAFWPKRLAFLRGASPLTPIEEIYESEIPFIGHHHEFTMGELRVLTRRSGLEIIAEDYYNYSADSTIAATLRDPLKTIVPALVKSARECLAVVCRKNGHD